MDTPAWVTAWIAGCAAGLALLAERPYGLEPAPGLLLIALGGVCLAARALGRADVRLWRVSVLAAFALAGGGRALLAHAPVTVHDLAYHTPASGTRYIELTGRVDSEPLLSDRSQRVYVEASRFRTSEREPWQDVSGRVLVLLPRYPSVEESDVVVARGALGPPPRGSGFDYAAYLARQRVYSYMEYPKVTATEDGAPSGLRWIVHAAREAARSALRRSVPEPQAALAIGVVTGDRTSLPQGLVDAFRKSGTTHVIAISGQNIALLVGLVFLIFARKSTMRRLPAWAAVLLLAGLGFYTLFTGATPSVVRAALMAAVLLAAPFAGRRYDPIAALAVAAFAMTASDPYVAADTGFQLSFGALLGISVFSKSILGALTRLRIPQVVSIVLAASLGAQAVTAPLLALTTGQVSLVSPLATLLVDFALLPLMLTGLLTAILGSFWAPLGNIIGLAVWVLGAWMSWWVTWWGSLPWAAITTGRDVGVGVFAYALALLAAGVLVTSRRLRVRFFLGIREAPATALLGAMALVIIVATLWLYLP